MWYPVQPAETGGPGLDQDAGIQEHRAGIPGHIHLGFDGVEHRVEEDRRVRIALGAEVASGAGAEQNQAPQPLP